MRAAFATIAIAALAATSHPVCGQNDALRLSEQMQKLGRLMGIADHNRFAYELAPWTQQTTAALANLPDSLIDSISVAPLQLIRLQHHTVLYFTRPTADGTSVYWLTKARGKAEAMSFADHCKAERTKRPAPADTAFSATPVSDANRRLDGFELTGLQNRRTLLCVPDVEARMLFEKMTKVLPDEQKDSLCTRLTDRLQTLWADSALRRHSWNGLPAMSTLQSKNGDLRICTFAVQYNDFNTRTFGALLMNISEKPDVCLLNDCTDDIRQPERTKCTPQKWYGAIYTQMIETEIDGRSSYTLLGFKGNDGLVKTRVIDILTIRNGKASFGMPVFLHPKATYQRRVFRYSANANMLLRYDESREAIVFDHLAPAESVFADEPQYYGPDFSYDSYNKSKKGWIFAPDIDLRNPRQKR